MDREKIEKALVVLRGDDPERQTSVAVIRRTEALLRAALDEADAIPEPTYYRPLTVARVLCNDLAERRERRAHEVDLPSEMIGLARSAEAFAVAEDAIFHALNVAANHADDDVAQQEINVYETLRRVASHA